MAPSDLVIVNIAKQGIYMVPCHETNRNKRQRNQVQSNANSRHLTFVWYGMF